MQYRTVKASERLPDKTGYYFITSCYGQDSVFFDAQTKQFRSPWTTFDNLQWLEIGQEEMLMSVKDHSLPLETPILVIHPLGVEAIHFWNARWRYWYSGTPVDNDVLQTMTHFITSEKLKNYGRRH